MTRLDPADRLAALMREQIATPHQRAGRPREPRSDMHQLPSTAADCDAHRDKRRILRGRMNLCLPKTSASSRAPQKNVPLGFQERS